MRDYAQRSTPVGGQGSLQIAAVNHPSAGDFLEFLHPDAFGRHRSLTTWGVRDALVSVCVLEGLPYTVLDELLADAPLLFNECSQCLCRDVWLAVRHLSVDAQDIRIRIGRGRELTSTAFQDAVLADDIVVVILVSTVDRFDVPVLESSLGTTARGLSVLRTTSDFFAKKIGLSPMATVRLAHPVLLKGSALRPADVELLHSLRYAVLSRDMDHFIASGASAALQSVPRNALLTSQNGPTIRRTATTCRSFRMKVHMDDIRQYLAPPPPPPRNIAPQTKPPKVLPPEVLPEPVRVVKYRPLVSETEVPLVEPQPRPFQPAYVGAEVHDSNSPRAPRNRVARGSASVYHSFSLGTTPQLDSGISQPQSEPNLSLRRSTTRDGEHFDGTITVSDEGGSSSSEQSFTTHYANANGLGSVARIQVPTSRAPEAFHPGTNATVYEKNPSEGIRVTRVKSNMPQLASEVSWQQRQAEAI